MKKIFLFPCLVIILSFLLSACVTPVARIPIKTEPGKIQRINCNPDSPYCRTY